LAVRRSLLVPCLIALTLPACSPKPTAVTPSIVGVVTSIEVRQSADPLVHLASGQAFDVTGAKALLGGMPFQGELLVAGGEGEFRWYYALRTNDDPDCPFLMSDGDAWEEPDAITFAVGLRLFKASDYQRPEPIRDFYDRSLFCVNEQGEITKAP
jgi:hypothetical protein